MSQPIGRNGIPAQWLVTSTINHAGGLMESILTEQEAKGWALVKWCWKETTAQCRDRSCSTCELAGYCQGDMRRDDLQGYIPIEEVIEVYNSVSIETWESEWCCFLRAVLGAVLRREYLDRVIQATEWASDWYTWGGVDWGYTNPSVLTVWQKNGDKQARCISSARWQQMTASELADEMAAICEAKHIQAIYADSSHPAHIRELKDNETIRRLGVKIRKVPFGSAQGREKPLKQRLLEELRCWVQGRGGRRLEINEAMSETIQELRGWHYKSETDVIAKEDDHGPDSCLCAMLPLLGPTVTTLSKLRGDNALRTADS